MKPFGTVVFVIMLLGASLFWIRARSAAHSRADARSAPIIITDTEKHLVTPEMAEAGREMLESPAPSFSNAATNGANHSLDELVRRGPVVLTFIKKGCPCSEAAQPFFNSLAATYPEASVLGVIDVDLDEAREWAERFAARYPLLIDPELSIIKSYNVRNSAYVVVIETNKKIVGYWPGYSVDMLRELSESVARVCGVSPRSIDASEAPSQLYSGCPFEY